MAKPIAEQIVSALRKKPGHGDRSGINFPIKGDRSNATLLQLKTDIERLFNDGTRVSFINVFTLRGWRTRFWKEPPYIPSSAE